MTLDVEQDRLAGYAYLIEKYRLKVVSNWHISLVSKTSTLRSTLQNGQAESVYPLSYWPGEGVGAHLEFALKYDGVNLSILSALFGVVPQAELTLWIASKSTGKYARKIWFLFEFLTEQILPLSPLTKGNYIPLLETDDYYTLAPGSHVQRQRVVNNLLGSRDFCPIVRRTKLLTKMESIDLHKRCEGIIKTYSPELLKRALSYLYNKETKSSFEIEHITPSASRAEKFIGLLMMAAHKDFCNKASLIDAQNLIVDPRFCDTDYRRSQNYIGQSISFSRQLVHYISPKPQDISGLMEGLLLSHVMMTQGEVPAVIHAAVIAYGFVFLHPFEDGNGRIHRFLIHNMLSLKKVIPKGLMFPVSAAMLKNPELYDTSLEAYSIPLMQQIEYELDEEGRMNVLNDTKKWYSYMDMTTQAEALYQFIQLTIEKELIEELEFLDRYDKMKEGVQAVVDMPDRLIDLFIQLCLQNNGRLSSNKRESHFKFLTDDEVHKMEAAIQ